MLLELLRHLLTPCPAAWRKMGYLREQIAIEARHGRNRYAWEPHMQASRDAILEAVGRCGDHREVLVVGAGLLNDVPLDQLARTFDRVLLADLVHQPAVRRRAASSGGKVHCVEFDVTGSLQKIHAASSSTSEQELLHWVETSSPVVPAFSNGRPDLVVSAGVASQLMLLPLAWLRKSKPRGEVFGEALQMAAFRRHLRWLEETARARLLLTDYQRHEVAPSGREIASSDTVDVSQLRAPDRAWRWRLAPIPELSRDYHVELTMGAWFGDFPIA